MELGLEKAGLSDKYRTMYMSKREDIIYTALKLFNAHSYQSVGIDRIISESGVAKMTFYKYFPSKEQLIQECLIQRNQDLQANITEYLAQYAEQGALQQLHGIFTWYGNWFAQPDFHGCMFQKALEEVATVYPSLTEPAMRYKKWLCTLMLDLLIKLKIADPLPLKAILISLLDGMTIQAHFTGQEVAVEEYWKRVELMLKAEALRP